MSNPTNNPTMKYQSAVEARQFTGQGDGQARDVALFAGLGNLIGYVEEPDGECVALVTATGPAIARRGDYVVSAAGGLEVVRRETFEAMFQPANG
jgi:hypothetical protein